MSPGAPPARIARRLLVGDRTYVQLSETAVKRVAGGGGLVETERPQFVGEVARCSQHVVGGHEARERRAAARPETACHTRASRHRCPLRAVSLSDSPAAALLDGRSQCNTRTPQHGEGVPRGSDATIDERPEAVQEALQAELVGMVRTVGAAVSGPRRRSDARRERVGLLVHE